jgi:voltage-gated potassium channel
VPKQALLDIRILRLRVFRIFADRASGVLHAQRRPARERRKILVFLSVVLMALLILGTLMYVVEGPKHGYTSIPVSVYWAIVTMTTVGYGDITPQTGLGKAIASFMMLLGWGILAVPTGIVSAEMTSQRLGNLRRTARVCTMGRMA